MWVSNQTLGRFHEAYYEGPYRGRLTSRGDPPNRGAYAYVYISPPKSRVKLNWVSLVDMLPPISRGDIESQADQGPALLLPMEGSPLDTTSKTKLTMSKYVCVYQRPSP